MPAVATAEYLASSHYPNSPELLIALSISIQQEFACELQHRRVSPSSRWPSSAPVSRAQRRRQSDRQQKADCAEDEFRNHSSKSLRPVARSLRSPYAMLHTPDA